MNDLQKIHDTFKELADITGELLECEAKVNAGEDMKEITESLMGRLVIKLMELQMLTQ